MSVANQESELVREVLDKWGRCKTTAITNFNYFFPFRPKDYWRCWDSNQVSSDSKSDALEGLGW